MTPPIETFEPMVEEWKLWTDGVCGAESFRIGILLQSQMGIKLWYVAKLAFIATNNAVEYEAVIMALRIIIEIGK